MKAVVLAYHDIGCVGLAALLRNGFDISAVFTHPDDPTEAIWFGSVAELAASHGISVFAPEDGRGYETSTALQVRRGNVLAA